MSEGNGKNGYIKFSTFAWIFGLLITGIFILVSNVVANDQQSRQRDENLQSCLHSYIIPMKEAIARIEAKLP